MSTLGWMFWGYLAGIVLVAGYVAWIGARLSALERRQRRIDSELGADR